MSGCFFSPQCGAAAHVAEVSEIILNVCVSLNAGGVNGRAALNGGN